MQSDNNDVRLKKRNVMELLNIISQHINIGEFAEAELLCNKALSDLNSFEAKNRPAILFNLAGFYIDLGHMSKKPTLSERGLSLMYENEKEFLTITSSSNYFYNLANAKSNMISTENPFELSFRIIEELVEVKNYFWKALKAKYEEGGDSLQLLVNLANSLKMQFRLSEGLRYYDIVNSHDENIPQAHINRSDSLKMLNQVTGSYSIKMMREVVNGYKVASESEAIPSAWKDYYRELASTYLSQIHDMGGETEGEATKDEYDGLSDYRKFCLDNFLTLSEHGLYCACAGSARDNLTIPRIHHGVTGDFVPQMEMILNRIKSEFSLARKNYYDFLYPSQDHLKHLHEDCFTELLNTEVLGIPVEKLRTSFRLCFGILDKIALAICELYDVRPKGQVYFQNFWRLGTDSRREKFEEIKNPGLLALYSIATDLNMHKNGEWASFKDWRNSLEHGLFIVVEDAGQTDPYKTFTNTNDIEIVSQKDFVYYVEHMLQLTRSAIFSFVFCVRSLASENETQVGITHNFIRKDFADN